MIFTQVTECGDRPLFILTDVCWERNRLLGPFTDLSPISKTRAVSFSFMLYRHQETEEVRIKPFVTAKTKTRKCEWVDNHSRGVLMVVSLNRQLQGNKQPKSKRKVSKVKPGEKNQPEHKYINVCRSVLRLSSSAWAFFAIWLWEYNVSPLTSRMADEAH